MRKATSSLAILAVLFVGIIVLVVTTNPAEAPIVPVQQAPSPVQPSVPAPASKDDLIVLDSPLPGSAIVSPLVLKGKARGNWYFEASFPIVLTDWDGKIIAEGHAEAQGDWMTSDYVPFTATLSFTNPATSVSDRGWLILQKDNPSGDPKFDNALEVEIKYR